MLEHIGCQCVVASNPAAVASAQCILLCGVGAFDHGMASLHEHGWIQPLQEAAFEARVPILGICLGMQLLFERSEEGQSPGLGWIPGEVRHLRSGRDPELRVPHMGWSPIALRTSVPVFETMDADARYYFVHSYAAVPDKDRNVVATADYGGQPFVAAVTQDNVVGVQFHPEKSHRHGKALIGRFLEDV